MSLDKDIKNNIGKILDVSIQAVELQTKLNGKRQELILVCVTDPTNTIRQDTLRRECHDLLDLIIDKETSLVTTVVQDALKNLNKD